jgi:hypothetical protein
LIDFADGCDIEGWGGFGALRGRGEASKREEDGGVFGHVGMLSDRLDARQRQVAYAVSSIAQETRFVSHRIRLHPVQNRAKNC